MIMIPHGGEGAGRNRPLPPGANAPASCPPRPSAAATAAAAPGEFVVGVHVPPPYPEIVRSRVYLASMVSVRGGTT